MKDKSRKRKSKGGQFEPELYTPERKAEFLLSNAVDEKDYLRAREEVIKMGLDPDHIKHYKPNEDK